MPTVSVVIPVYNAESFLLETLDSIRAQTFKDLEVICIDDVSTDNSTALIESYGGIRLIRRQRNSGGCSVPRNDGITSAAGDFVALCDADDVMVADKIAAQVQYLQRHPEVDFCFTDFVDFDDTGLKMPHIQTCLEFLQTIGPRTSGAAHILAPPIATRILVNENFIGASSMLFRKSMIERVGMFREELRSSEDIDFVLRVAAGGPIAFIDQIGHKRRLHATNMSHNKRKMLTNYAQVLRDRYSGSRDKVERRRLRNQLSSVYESLAYVMRRERDRKASLYMAFLAARWSVLRLSAYREMVKAAVAPVISTGAPRGGDLH